MTEPDDIATGTIDVLRSLSSHPFVAEQRELVHKIGVTGGKVEPAPHCGGERCHLPVGWGGERSLACSITAKAKREQKDKTQESGLSRFASKASGKFRVGEA